MIENDKKEGLIPFFYGATYGSTFNAAKDLSHEFLEICEKEKMWVSLDAAYLGSSWICP